MNYKRLVIGFALLFAMLFFIVQGPYLWKLLQFALHKPHTTVYQQQQSGQPPVKGEPNKLVIESLNITAPVLYVTGNNEDVFQKALQDGVVHYPGTANPGERGNVYIFGHSSDFALTPGHFKTVFTLLPKIEIGAQISLSDQAGNQFTYVVTDKFVAEKTDTKLLDQRGYTQKLLTVQTSYPIGTALKRYIVLATLKE